MPKYKTPSFPCMNCKAPIKWERTEKLYCSELCKQTAKYVRYHRACREDGRDLQPDVQEALKIRRASILSGGYPEEERRLNSKTRTAILKRDKRLCCKCGKKGTEIDHIKGSSNSMSNLQLLCSKCHLKKSKSNLVELKPDNPAYGRHLITITELNKRVERKKPLLPCDNHNDWEEKRFKIREKRNNDFWISLKPILQALTVKDLTLQQIAGELNRREIPTFRGEFNWDRHSVSKMKQNLKL